MQPADIGRPVSVSSPCVSPDGRRVAFVVRRVDLAANTYRSAVWLAHVDDSVPPFPITSGEHSDGQPAWSPDGRRLAFTSRRGAGSTESSLHVLPVDGPGETVLLCARPEAVEAPSWSPDGTRIAFVSRERAQRWSDGDDERARPPRRIDRLFSRLDDVGWTIDRPAGVFVVAANGAGTPVQVASGPYDHSDPVWAPDGRSLVVAAGREDGWDVDGRTDLYAVDAGGVGEPRAITKDGSMYGLPAFDASGTRVAALVTDPRVVPTHSDVVVLDVAGGSRVAVPTADVDRQCAPAPGARPPIWDGDTLLFGVEDHGDTHVLRVRAEGGGTPELVVGGTRNVTGYDLAAGTLAFTAGSPTELPELHVLVDGEERQLTSLNAAFHADVPPAAPEHFTVASPAGDGEIDAWLIRPREPVDAASVPLLVSIHGGPMTQYGNTWFDEFQLWASAGYAVVYCNPHGSTGHTDAFTRAIRPPEADVEPGTGWGGIDADDVLAVLDAALEREPVLDRDRVGVLGGSYGGYLTSWLVGHSDRFAAACSERAVNNMESEEWSSDAGGWFRWEMGVNHLDAPEVYRRISPVTYVRDITTPLLIIHSENDLRCPVEQADALFVALRMLGREVEYWRFPEEGHELSRTGSPRHRVQRAELILDWFGRHLGGRRPAITWDHPSRE